MVLIHFNLKNGLLIKKKKVVDIQFYTEVRCPCRLVCPHPTLVHECLMLIPCARRR